MINEVTTPGYEITGQEGSKFHYVMRNEGPPIRGMVTATGKKHAENQVADLFNAWVNRATGPKRLSKPAPVAKTENEGVTIGD